MELSNSGALHVKLSNSSTLHIELSNSNILHVKLSNLSAFYVELSNSNALMWSCLALVHLSSFHYHLTNILSHVIRRFIHPSNAHLSMILDILQDKLYIVVILAFKIKFFTFFLCLLI